MLQLLLSCLFKAITPKGAAGPSPLVIIVVTMESAIPSLDNVVRRGATRGGGGGARSATFCSGLAQCFRASAPVARHFALPKQTPLAPPLSVVMSIVEGLKQFITFSNHYI